MIRLRSVRPSLFLGAVPGRRVRAGTRRAHEGNAARGAPDPAGGVCRPVGGALRRDHRKDRAAGGLLGSQGGGPVLFPADRHGGAPLGVHSVGERSRALLRAREAQQRAAGPPSVGKPGGRRHWRSRGPRAGRADPGPAGLLGPGRAVVLRRQGRDGPLFPRTGRPHRRREWPEHRGVRRGVHRLDPPLLIAGALLAPGSGAAHAGAGHPAQPVFGNPEPQARERCRRAVRRFTGLR